MRHPARSSLHGQAQLRVGIRRSLSSTYAFTLVLHQFSNIPSGHYRDIEDVLIRRIPSGSRFVRVSVYGVSSSVMQMSRSSEQRAANAMAMFLENNPIHYQLFLTNSLWHFDDRAAGKDRWEKSDARRELMADVTTIACTNESYSKDVIVREWLMW